MPDLIRILNPFCGQVAQALQNGLNFTDNIRANFVVVSFPKTANQNVQIQHGLAATPIGYVPIRISAACSIYDGVSLVIGPTFVNLKCSVAGITATILFF
jgi:hypothetical protein